MWNAASKLNKHSRSTPIKMPLQRPKTPRPQISPVKPHSSKVSPQTDKTGTLSNPSTPPDKYWTSFGDAHGEETDATAEHTSVLNKHSGNYMLPHLSSAETPGLHSKYRGFTKWWINTTIMSKQKLGESWGSSYLPRWLIAIVLVQATLTEYLSGWRYIYDPTWRNANRYAMSGGNRQCPNLVNILFFFTNQ